MTTGNTEGLRNRRQLAQQQQRDKRQSLRHVVSLSERKFNVKELPADMFRVYSHLKAKFGEEYALIWVFTMRTAVELHRAWHMTLLTSKILQQIKDKVSAWEDSLSIG